jgi:3-hydroxymyristoyl/3-hydroxydecanoyl-(acyl carrier protein) dehydratase
VGSIAAVLGPEYAAVDRFPTRVRLPDEPLLLVDRILTIEGEPRSLQAGRIVTEHVVQAGAWYLDSGKAPACIAIEAGQADLFLSAYLGADFVTEGRAVYRLLDATVTFQRGLPVPGEVIRYDIRISRFFRQGETILFRFEFDATVNGKPLLSMRDGCAGFFSADELSAGKGIVAHKHAAERRERPRRESWRDLVPVNAAQLDSRQLDALRHGDLVTAFGAPFARAATIDPVRLPAERMALLDRVSLLEPRGGPHWLGLIRAEADINPADWFLVCHFIDDRVMPGTLMYECCLHALRVLLMRIGWVGPRDAVSFEPVAGIANRLRCRGQVIESTRVVSYEVTIKELGYHPQPIAVADALICADGKPIVEVRDMALQLSGSDLPSLERLWETPGAIADPALAPPLPQAIPHPGQSQLPEGRSSLRETAFHRGLRTSASSVESRAQSSRAMGDGNFCARPEHAGDGGRELALFTRDQILEFAVGKPSRAFGDRYRRFDEGRFIARLPAPPFQFIDRITRIEAEPWVMAAGSSATAEYDVTPDAWYFEAARQQSIPHAVLLEAALQACGWLAAYMGSALNSDDDLKFRILGGTALKRRGLARRAVTLSTTVTANKISKSAGMILQQYHFAIESDEGVVYDGVADLGFFHPSSLARPDGAAGVPASTASEAQGTLARSFAYPTGPPFPDSSWRMVDEIDDLRLAGGPHGLGSVRGSARVDPESWLFKAHFLDDPVWPGSLGQEAMLQLLKVAARERFGATVLDHFEAPGLAIAHSWTYRGQITRESRQMTIQADVKRCDDSRRLLVADGSIEVDGRVIYHMRDYSLQIVES